MSYEDNYNPATGEKWYSVESMDTDELIAYCIWWVASFPIGYLGNSGVLALVMHCIINPLLVAGLLLFFLKKHEQNLIHYSMLVNIVLVLVVVLFFVGQFLK